MKKVGTYRLGLINVDLYLIPGYSSSLTYNQDKKKPRLEIGAAHEQWWKILCELLHEAEEFILILYNYTFTPVFVDAQNSTTYIFNLTHGDLIKVNEEVAYFIAKAQNDLCKAWKKYQKKLSK